MRRCGFVAVLMMMSTSVLADQIPKGWIKAGQDPQDYEIGIDRSVVHSGSASSFLNSNHGSPKTFGTLMQVCGAQEHVRKRVRLTAFVKAEGVVGRAGLWFRIDGKSNKMLGFDNMKDRPIQGTSDWKSYSIVLDVPTDSINLAFGVLLSGAGKVWLDDLTFEEVGLDVPTTDLTNGREPHGEPMNLDFEG